MQLPTGLDEGRSACFSRASLRAPLERLAADFIQDLAGLQVGHNAQFEYRPTCGLVSSSRPARPAELLDNIIDIAIVIVARVIASHPSSVTHYLSSTIYRRRRRRRRLNHRCTR
jgi:hypothetical protein